MSTAAAAGAATSSDVIAAAYELVPVLRAQAAACERERRVSDATIDALHGARLFDIVKPRRYGGFELGWDVFCEAVVAIASGCGSTGWVYAVVGGHAPVAARFGTDFLDEMWGENPRALMSSCRRGSGQLTPVSGGFRATGSGLYSSGCLNADWVIVEDMPVVGSAQTVTMVIPRRDVTVLDTWHVVGLCGTGSNDLTFEDLFVPGHRIWYPGKAPSGAALEGALFRTPHLGGPYALPAVLLGIALGSLEQFIAFTAKRTRRALALSATESMQMRVGESAAELDAAHTLLRVKLQELMATWGGLERDDDGILPAGGKDAGYEHLLMTFVAQASYSAINRLMLAAGASQMKLSESFQRSFRDVLAGIQQPSNDWDRGRIDGGRALFAAQRKASDA